MSSDRNKPTRDAAGREGDGRARDEADRDCMMTKTTRGYSKGIRVWGVGAYGRVLSVRTSGGVRAGAW